MMSKKQWFVLLCIFVIYLLLGAALFHNIESKEETKRLEIEKEIRKEIQELLKAHMSDGVPPEIYDKLSDYCGKPLKTDMEFYEDRRRWDFYHALFFVITVVSTIGYGNLAPTTMFGRIFMIFYGLIGIPMNGIVMVTLGNFFGRSFAKLYHRWKTAKMQYDPFRLGLISQIILYLVPGFTFFIFLPAVLMVICEGWAYDVAVYYAFVTLTTIGFGDYVAGVEDINHFGDFYYMIYKLFLLVWVIGGLGYVVMILGFITEAMRSKKMQELEHIITQNIKKTPTKIRQELRSLMHEFLFLRVKRVYKGDFEYTPKIIERSQSCPDLTIYRNMNSPTMMRKRAFSECPRTFMLHRIQSETDLQRIDKELTFKPINAFMEQQQLLIKVANAFADNFQDDNSSLNLPSNACYDGFSDSQILASEKYGSQLSLRSEVFNKPMRRRAISEIKVPTLPSEDDNGPVRFKVFRERTLSEPNAGSKTTPGFLTRLKNRFMPSSKADEKNTDIEKQDLTQFKDNKRASVFSNLEDNYLRQTSGGRLSTFSLAQQDPVLEQTSLADFIRALSAIAVPTEAYNTPLTPKRKLGTAGLNPIRNSSPPRNRRLAIRPNLHYRRSSLMPTTSSVNENIERRFSLTPVEENLLAPPPPYTPPAISPLVANVPSTSKRFSKILSLSAISGPVQRHLNIKKEKEDSQHDKQ